MTNTQKHAKRELNILKTHQPDNIITPFTNEILSLCEAFGKSGQSNNSVFYIASILTETINKLLLQQPIYDIMGEDDEWNDITEYNGVNKLLQNNRCSTLFKENNEAYYLDAIIWKGPTKHDTFTGTIYIDDKDFVKISSHQYVKFPFIPKTFYIDVIYIPITKEEAIEQNINYTEDLNGKCFYTIIKDTKQLKKVFKYYLPMIINKYEYNHE